MENIIHREKAVNRYTEQYPDHYTDYNLMWQSENVLIAVEVKSEKVILKPFSFEQHKQVTVLIGESQYLLPWELRAIAKQIEESKEILNYGFDWDDESGLPTSEATFTNAAEFLILYSNDIYNNYHLILDTPYVDILKDGSVSVHWETSVGKLLIIFKQNTALAYYYAERKDNNIPFKSAVEIGKPVDPFLALWMKKYLTRQ